MSQIEEQVRTFIVENFLFGDDAGLESGSSFLEEGFIDSTGVLELVNFLEKTYSITVEDDELIPENLDTLASVVAFVQRKNGATEWQVPNVRGR